MTKYIVSYFGILGRAEPIRLAFVQGGIPFTNKAFTYDEFKAIASTLPSAALPTLEILQDDGTKHVVDQSNAMLRFAGKVCGLYPTDPLEALAVDQIIDTIEEAHAPLGATMYGPKRLFFSDKLEALSDEHKMEIRKTLMDPTVHRNVAYFLRILETRLEASKSGWFVGDGPTIADLRAHSLVYWLTAGILDGVPTDCLDTYPKLKAVYANVEALPAVAAYRAKYGTKYSDFDYAP